MSLLPFRDRRAAGRDLAARLARHAHRPDVTVLALPRGGVPVAAEVAAALGVPLDVFMVRKLGLPGQPEVAMGAIASGGTRVLNEDIVAGLEIQAATVDAVTAEETLELLRRERVYREARPAPALGGRTVLLVDDGAATGATMRVAVTALRQHHPARIVVALPVASAGAALRLAAVADDVVCSAMPEPFQAVALWYGNFDPVEDRTVHDLLAAARQRQERVA